MSDYYDSAGNPCTLDVLCSREPAWAANRIRAGLDRIAQLEAVPDPQLALALDPLHPTGHCTCAGEGRCTWCLMDAWRGRAERAELALRNVRALAVRMQRREVPDAAEHLLRFCAEAGVVAEILRGPDDTADLERR